jgi:hypothetical protein
MKKNMLLTLYTMGFSLGFFNPSQSFPNDNGFESVEAPPPPSTPLSQAASMLPLWEGRLQRAERELVSFLKAFPGYRAINDCPYLDVIKELDKMTDPIDQYKRVYALPSRTLQEQALLTRLRSYFKTLGGTENYAAFKAAREAVADLSPYVARLRDALNTL